jgi:hypothetical protein
MPPPSPPTTIEFLVADAVGLRVTGLFDVEFPVPQSGQPPREVLEADIEIAIRSVLIQHSARSK